MGVLRRLPCQQRGTIGNGGTAIAGIRSVTGDLFHPGPRPVEKSTAFCSSVSVRPILECTRESRPNPHSKPAEPAGRVAPAQNQKEVPRGGSAGWRPEPKRSRVGAKRSCRAQRQGCERPGSGSLPPRKYPRGSRVFSNSSPIVLSKGARNSDPRSRVKSLEV